MVDVVAKVSFANANSPQKTLALAGNVDGNPCRASMRPGSLLRGEHRLGSMLNDLLGKFKPCATTLLLGQKGRVRDATVVTLLDRHSTACMLR